MARAAPCPQLSPRRGPRASRSASWQTPPAVVDARCRAKLGSHDVDDVALTAAACAYERGLAPGAMASTSVQLDVARPLGDARSFDLPSLPERNWRFRPHDRADSQDFHRWRRS